MKSIEQYHLIQPYLKHITVADPDVISQTPKGDKITKHLVGVCHKVIDDLTTGPYKDELLYPIISITDNVMEFVLLSPDDMEEIINEGLVKYRQIIPVYHYIRRHAH